jgi:hypothetical protein
MFGPLERALQGHLTRWHGHGAEHQHDYYRCNGCQRVVTHTLIRHGGCRCGHGNKLQPTTPRFWEQVQLLVFPWTVRR